MVSAETTAASQSLREALREALREDARPGQGSPWPQLPIRGPLPCPGSEGLCLVSWGVDPSVLTKEAASGKRQPHCEQLKPSTHSRKP